MTHQIFAELETLREKGPSPEAPLIQGSLRLFPFGVAIRGVLEA
jgi:hypothetical protein